jgi:hypothetical protein
MEFKHASRHAKAKKSGKPPTFFWEVPSAFTQELNKILACSLPEYPKGTFPAEKNEGQEKKEEAPEGKAFSTCVDEIRRQPLGLKALSHISNG